MQKVILVFISCKNRCLRYALLHLISIKWMLSRRNNTFVFSSLPTIITGGIENLKKNPLVTALLRMGQKCLVIWKVNHPAH